MQWLKKNDNFFAIIFVYFYDRLLDHLIVIDRSVRDHRYFFERDYSDYLYFEPGSSWPGLFELAHGKLELD